MTGVREKQKQKTRSQLLEAARGLFEERGFRKTTIRQVAERAGVGVGTVFVHFPDKASLLAASFYGSLDQVVEEAFERLDPEQHIVDILLHFARELYRWYLSDVELSVQLLKESLLLGGEWGERSREQSELFIFRLVAFVEEAKARGEVAEEVDGFLAMVGFFSSYLTLLFGILKEPEVPLESHMQMLERMIRFLLRLPAEKEKGEQR